MVGRKDDSWFGGYLKVQLKLAAGLTQQRRIAMLDFALEQLAAFAVQSAGRAEWVLIYSFPVKIRVGSRNMP